MTTARRPIVKLFRASNRGVYKLWALLCFLMLPLTFNACGKQNALLPLGSVNLLSTPMSDVQVNFCEPPPAPLKTAIKTVIVLDHSGSNTNNYQMNPADGSPAGPPGTSPVIVPTLATDPTGITRYGTPTQPNTLLNYLANLVVNPPTSTTTQNNQYFALVDFNSTAPVNSTAASRYANSFTSDLAGFYQAVYSDAGYVGSPPATAAAITSWTPPTGSAPPADTSATNYIDALTQAHSIIQADILAAQACAIAKTASASCPTPGVVTMSSYIVIFMSDGSPITALGTPGAINSSNCPAPNQIIGSVICKQAAQTILGRVGSLTALGRGSNQQFVASVNLFTIYYYHPGNVDTSGQALLKDMAAAGNGLFYNVTSGTTVDYTQFQPPTKTIQYSLSDIFVTNTSASYWDDGGFYRDSDGDGLPDHFEKVFGTSPTSSQTQNNGISDLVRYRLANGICTSGLGTDGLCRDAPISYSGTGGACAGISRTAGLYKSSDPNGLNDCEKILLGDAAGVGHPDSNQDSIPDWLEFKNFIPFQTGTAPQVSSPQLDGYTMYDKVKFSLPATLPVTNMINIVPANYNLNLVSSANMQKCYSLQVTNFPVTTETDRVRVDITFKSNLGDSARLYEVGHKSFASGNTRLLIEDWNLGSPDIGVWSAWK